MFNFLYRKSAQIIRFSTFMSISKPYLIKYYYRWSDLKDKYKSSTNSEEFNKDALKVLLEYKVIDVKSVDKLVERNKIKINDKGMAIISYTFPKKMMGKPEGRP